MHNHASVIKKGANEKRLHRDILQWSRAVISILVYTQDSNEKNGGTEIIPTSQYFPFVDGKQTDLPKHAGTWMDAYDKYSGLEMQALPVPMKKGEILIMDSLVFHTPTVNKTDYIRYAITGAYHSIDELNLSSNEQSVLISGEKTYCGNEYNWETK